MLNRIKFALLALCMSAAAFGQTNTNLNNFGSAPTFNITSPTNGQCVVYQSVTSTWVNSSCTAAGSVPLSSLQPQAPGTIVCNTTQIAATPTACTGLTNTSAAADAPALFQFYQSVTGTGGTAGFVMNTLGVTTVIPTEASALNDYVWGLTSKLDTWATGSGQHLALAAVTTRHVGTGGSPVWGTLFSVADSTFNSSATEGAGMTGDETDIYASSTDTAGIASGNIPSGQGVRIGHQVELYTYTWPSTCTTTNSSSSVSSCSSTLTSNNVVAGLAVSDSLGCIPANDTVATVAATSFTLTTGTNASGCGASDVITFKSATPTTIGWGYRVVGNGPGTTNPTVTQGFTIDNATIGKYGFSCMYASFASGADCFASNGYSVDSVGNTAVNSLTIAASTALSASGCSYSSLTGDVVPLGPVTVGGGSLSAGATGTCTVALTLPAVIHGWSCSASDVTSQIAFIQTARSTTGCTVSAAATSGDIISLTLVGT
jgi:hypothetical protein